MQEWVAINSQEVRRIEKEIRFLSTPLRHQIKNLVSRSDSYRVSPQITEFNYSNLNKLSALVPLGHAKHEAK